MHITRSHTFGLILLSLGMAVSGCGTGSSEDDPDQACVEPGCSDRAVDADADGVAADQDCDDADASSTVRATDADCDGVLAADDCDDVDATSTVRAQDTDCDGAESADDCDDADPNSSTLATDADCDGYLTTDDCDDADPDSTVRTADADCDGVLSADDCDDTDPALPATADIDDPDCDGFPTHAGGGSLVPISPMTFDMGCTAGQADCYTDESPVMPVTLTHAYYISETEVTSGEYELVMGANPSYNVSCGADCPVEQVDWHMAAAFTNALSAAAELQSCYSCTGEGSSTECSIVLDAYACNGYRLPTEAEWEAAARCGEDLRYAGSDNADDVAWYSETSPGTKTSVVATRAPNACGLYDMSGNVWEWVQDWYSSTYYTASGYSDPQGPDSGTRRGQRGGDYGSDASSLRVSNRSSNDPDTRGFDYGFRIARTMP
jgi:formylglycine-generating enzyme required for sulfatase activity